MTSETPTRTRRSRRSASRPERSAQPGQNLHLRTPFITRGIPTYDLLNDESLEKIEATADRILAEIGIEVRDDSEAVRLYREAGATVTDVSAEAWNVKFEPGMVREILKTAPARFTQCARNPANNVEIGTDAMVFAPAYGSPFVMDLE